MLAVPEALAASLPWQGMVTILRTAHARFVNPRLGLIAGAVISGVVALVLAISPAGWLENLLAVSGRDATGFLVRRYGASATAALCVATGAIALGLDPRRAALRALAAWFGVQAAVALWGVTTGAVGGLAWLAVLADPLLGAWFFALSAKAEHRASTGSARVATSPPTCSS